MLILGAGVAGAMFGDWAFKAVIWLGMGLVVLGALVYILDAWGVGKAPPARPSSRRRKR